MRPSAHSHGTRDSNSKSPPILKPCARPPYCRHSTAEERHEAIRHPVGRPAGLVGRARTAGRVRHAGTRGHDYGDAPKGLLIIDGQGRYSLQIYRSDRPHYASGDRARGTPAEYQANALGISTHFGTLQVDPGVLVFNIDSASFPNQDGTQQKRPYTLDGDELSYRVPARPN